MMAIALTALCLLLSILSIDLSALPRTVPPPRAMTGCDRYGVLWAPTHNGKPVLFDPALKPGEVVATDYCFRRGYCRDVGDEVAAFSNAMLKIERVDAPLAVRNRWRKAAHDNWSP